MAVDMKMAAYISIPCAVTSIYPGRVHMIDMQSYK